MALLRFYIMRDNSVKGIVLVRDIQVRLVRNDLCGSGS